MTGFVESAERLVDQGGIAFAHAGRPRPFYVKVARLTPDDGPDQRCVEVLFNPEWVEFGGHSTDVIVRWGTRADTVVWVADLLEELEAELCPPAMTEEMDDLLFGVHRAPIEEPDPSGSGPIWRI